MTAWKNLVPNRKVLHQLKREAVLRQAVTAFSKNGFHATSLDDIANSVGVTKAALYHYYPNKHALLFEAFSEALRVAFECLDKAKLAGSNGLERIQMALEGYLSVSLHELSRCVILTEEHALLPEHQEIIFQKRDMYEGQLRELVREGMRDGSVIPCDPKLAIFTIYGAINWVPKWFREEGAWTNEQLAFAMAQLVCRSIAANPLPALPTDVSQIKIEK